jgi:hypothetical protein
MTERDSGPWGGNPRIAFEWGNIPMQPNDDRSGVVLGSKGIHAVNGTEWNTFPDFNRSGYTGNSLEGGDAYYVPSYTFCWSNPKTKDGNVWDYIEYLRTVGVDPAILKEATFTGGEDQYDTSGDAEYDSGIIFWSYIPEDEIIWIDWSNGTVYTGKDFHETITAMYSDAGEEVDISANVAFHSVVAFTNDPAKNTADWWY